RRLRTGIRVGRVHAYGLLGPDDHPRGTHQQLVRMPFAVIGTAAGFKHLPGRSLPVDRIEELTVLQHFGPDAAVDAATQVLDELSVDVFGDRRAGSRSIHGDGGAGGREY